MNAQTQPIRLIRWLAIVLSALILTTITTQAATTEIIEKSL